MASSDLPIAAFRDQIVTAVAENPVVIVTAETGAGKSTQVPRFLLDEGYDIVVTQPRSLAAKTVAERVAHEAGTPVGGLIGFRTSDQRKQSGATRCLFTTDGLALVRELTGARRASVLVLDEVHEWNLNIETLVALRKLQLEKGADFKLVLMSATLQAEELAAYFGGAPIISVPGRAFPVEERPASGADLEQDVVSLLKEGRNVLVFQPGKAEISQTIGRLRAVKGLNAEIVPLHGELTPQDQARAFAQSGRPKCVVSTNVAQTSVTIPDIDAVVDSGLERRVELVNGVDGLYVGPISLADRAQRKGRAGRTRPGIYIDWCTKGGRREFAKAEILRRRLETQTLRLAVAGFDVEELRFFHQPGLRAIREAKRALRALGCTDADGKVTRTGRRVAKLPVSVQHARMIMEADRLGVTDDVITVAAILEQGEINARLCGRCRKAGAPRCSCWQRLVSDETSDIMAQLAVYRAAKRMSRKEMTRAGVSPKAFYQAKEKRRRLAGALRGKVGSGSNGRRENILRAVCAGMVDHLYERQYGYYSNGDGVSRTLARESFVGGAQWLIGLPWDLEVESHYGGTHILRLVRMATPVDPEWLIDVAPHLTERREGLDPAFDDEQDEVVSTTQLLFNGQVIKTFRKVDPSYPDAAELRRAGRNERQWRSWTERPEIALPDVTGADTVPEIVVRTYGADAETGEPLRAYGTVAPYGDRCYDSDPWFEVLWDRDPEVAAEHRRKAVSSLESIRAEASAEAERQVAAA
ncbi:helicase-related protein [Spirillospora sp. CA-142024]|uniref:helicase-related protein n=1 Tax=Spirillospora sp. CA-142024 TaxID=3240036 RepID=UPI003D94627F